MLETYFYVFQDIFNIIYNIFCNRINLELETKLAHMFKQREDKYYILGVKLNPIKIVWKN